ncbi:MAG TPA: hypothetical protein VEA16_21980 [Vicinamibacterales bacterium]|nr:hypothetical protein [Vicinamibacterales bacterium]
MIRRILIAALLVVASLESGSAAITSATFQGYERIGVNAYRVRVRLIDSVTGSRDEWFTATGDTAAQIRDDVSRQIAERVRLESTRDVLAGISVGTNIPVSYTPPAPAVPTAFQVWAEKARRLQRLEALGLTNATAASEIAALRTDVNNTYQAGYAAQF